MQILCRLHLKAAEMETLRAGPSNGSLTIPLGILVQTHSCLGTTALLPVSHLPVQIRIQVALAQDLLCWSVPCRRECFHIGNIVSVL